MWGIPSSMKVSEEFLERFLMKYRLSIKLLVSKSFIAVGKKYDTTIGEAVLLDVVLHDTIFFAASITCMISAMSVGLASLIILFILLFSLSPVLRSQIATLADGSSRQDSCRDSPDGTLLPYRNSPEEASQRPEADDSSSVPRRTPFR